MRTEIHPAVRRITWLMIVIGAGATLVAVSYFLFNLGPGVMLPFTKTALDAGWLAIFGLLWLVSGVLLLWWLRPEGPSIARTELSPNKQMAENIQDLMKRLSSMEETVQRLNTQIGDSGDLADRMTKFDQALEQQKRFVAASKQAPVNGSDSRVLDHELDNLGTALQDVNKRLDKVDDVANRVHDLDTQLDALYVTLHDVHQRIDSLEQTVSR
jgi:prefoldin subunit 5